MSQNKSAFGNSEPAESTGAPPSPGDSARYKESGNRFFQMKKYAAALACYRRGLEKLDDLPPSNDDIRTCAEVAFRSNAALTLIKLAGTVAGDDDATPPPLEERRRFATDGAKECSLALKLDPANAKLWYRRATARMVLMESSEVAAEGGRDGRNDKRGGGTMSDASPGVWSEAAGSDLLRCLSLLQEQQLRLQQQRPNDNASKSTLKSVLQQMLDAKRALQRVRASKGARRLKSQDSTQRGQQHQYPQHHTERSQPLHSLSGQDSNDESKSVPQPETEGEDRSGDKENNYDKKSTTPFTCTGTSVCMEKVFGKADYATKNSTELEAQDMGEIICDPPAPALQQQLEHPSLSPTRSSASDHDGIPSPERQRQCILQLLMRRSFSSWHPSRPEEGMVEDRPAREPHSQSFPPAPGEAYFLLNMPWWETWCRYVDFFFSENEDENWDETRRGIIFHDSKESGGMDGCGHDCDRIGSHLGGNDAGGANVQASLNYSSRMSKKDVLRRLPPGATFPSYLSDSNKDGRHQGTNGRCRSYSSHSSTSSCSSSSEDENNAYEFGMVHAPPGVIDNSSLFVRGGFITQECSNVDSLWGDDFSLGWNYEYDEGDYGNTLHTTDTAADDAHPWERVASKSVFLRAHLVRGYHFEVLPREAYSALRSWFGERTPLICRRAVPKSEISQAMVTSCPRHLSVADSRESSAGVPSLVLLVLYPERWHSTRRESAIPAGHFKCGACLHPLARARCTKCLAVRYCNRGCQIVHWPYHKPICRVLTKQRQQHEKDNLHARDIDMRRWENSGLVPKDLIRGRVGLNNLGNTCFLNAALQVQWLCMFRTYRVLECMSHVVPLTQYFISDRFRADLNPQNVLSAGGKVALAYASVVRDLWMGGYRHGSVSPTVLKRAIELFAPRFAGVSQQDAPEFLAFLLDALHEDLNRIRDPPYVEMPDANSGKKLSICGAEAWDAHSRRNSSHVFDTFYGMFKSTCVCPRCDQVSVSFETFNHITIEIPQKNTVDVVVVLVRDCDEANHSLPTRYCCTVPHQGIVEDLKRALSGVSGVPISRLAICNVQECNLIEVYQDKKPIPSLMSDSCIVAYEIVPHNETSIRAIATHTSGSDDENTFCDGGDLTVNARKLFGIPFFTSFKSTLSCEELCEKVWNAVKTCVVVDDTGMPKNHEFELRIKARLKIRVVDQNGRPITFLAKNSASAMNSRSGELLYTSIISPFSHEKLGDMLGQGCAEKFLLLSLEWSGIITDEFYVATQNNVYEEDEINCSMFSAVADHSSFLGYQQKSRVTDGKSFVTLDQCFESFTEPERLDEENRWYCSKCKDHVRAMKTVSFWRIPNVLVIHLKRFEYRHAFRRDKLGILVDFPLDGLDMSKHCTAGKCGRPSPQDESRFGCNEFLFDRVPAIYDLFGVTNHYGRMGFGHYTAFARNWDENDIEKEWALFDDSNVQSFGENISNRCPGPVVTPAAYVLFYRRRGF